PLPPADQARRLGVASTLPILLSDRQWPLHDGRVPASAREALSHAALRTLQSRLRQRPGALLRGCRRRAGGLRAAAPTRRGRAQATAELPVLPRLRRRPLRPAARHVLHAARGRCCRPRLGSATRRWAQRRLPDLRSVISLSTWNGREADDRSRPPDW